MTGLQSLSRRRSGVPGLAGCPHNPPVCPPLAAACQAPSLSLARARPTSRVKLQHNSSPATLPPDGPARRPSLVLGPPAMPARLAMRCRRSPYSAASTRPVLPPEDQPSQLNLGMPSASASSSTASACGTGRRDEITQGERAPSSWAVGRQGRQLAAVPPQPQHVRGPGRATTCPPASTSAARRLAHLTPRLLSPGCNSSRAGHPGSGSGPPLGTP